MRTIGLSTFETAIGICGIAWGPAGLRGTSLPEIDRARTLSRLTQKDPGASEWKPPEAIARAIARIVALIDGRCLDDDLTGIELDMAEVPAFDRRVYAVARTVAPGSTLTYGEVAARLGERGLARAVGGALGRNPFPIVVPCHRVLAAGGRLGGFTAPGGGATKLRLLQIERARTGAEPLLFDHLSTAPGR